MNLQQTYPTQLLPGIGGATDRLAAIQAAVAADEAVFSGTSTNTFVDIVTTALITPANLAVTQGPLGTAGSTDYSYVVADLGNGGTAAPCTAVQTTTGNATLSATNTNVITWSAIIGHTYGVYRSASSGTPSGTGLIGTVGPVTSGAGTFTDTGITGTLNVPTVNTTAALSPAGPIFAGAPIYNFANVQTLNNASNQTLTVTQITNGILERLGAGTVTDTLPTAAALVAALPGAKNNQAFNWVYRNHTGNNATLAAGNGGNNATGNTLVVGSAKAGTFALVLTDVVPGNEAYVLYSLGSATY